MRKIFILTKREFLTAVRTKSFLIGLIIAPIFMGGSFAVIKLFEDKVDIVDKNIVVIDHSGIMAESLEQISEERNKNIYDETTKEKIRPAYNIEIVEPEKDNLEQQKLDLSERVSKKKLHAFVEIGPEILHPGDDREKYRMYYYSENSMMDDIRSWISRIINNQLRQLRVVDLNIPAEQSKDLFYWIEMEGMGLFSINEETGSVKDAKKSNIGEAVAVPYILMMIMFMMVMMFTIPLLSAVMEEKTERIAEVILGSVTPFQFMMSKILGSILVSIIGSSVYIIGGAIAATQMGFSESIPYDLLPWFFTFLLLNIIMVGSLMAALGSACDNSKDAQSLQFPAMLPVLLPMFVMFPMLKAPLGAFSTAMSLIPPFTPMLMTVRMATPVNIPVWQPIVGLFGVILFTALIVWISGRIFRTCILMQGTPPKFMNLVKWAVKG
ncbi:MAG: ABC transporter permease [Bacteroidetes bacterium]|mgnify:CR=1 FL=1|jgi:ABC-2 type transport system permease protein|nr:ABC transporter permease [Bacteroidota bacterium]MBT6686971.1 ABC transporter permease [Bacteroidota bacterium]MBT7142427.1 ABC transporter permease [Bacteroidota bacterium]MBT7490608.1 ABC transporter permease [Bacteroidota bacterium]